MSVVANLRYVYRRLTGRFYIPPVLLNSEEVKILHISDTPTTFYTSIEYLIKVLKPEIIIHTGDLADDFKLEMDPGMIDEYRQAVVPFLQMLQDSTAREVVIIPGNHDNIKIIKENAGRIDVFSEGKLYSAEGIVLGLAHMPGRLPGDADYQLYGHDFTKLDAVALNAMENVNVILCSSKNVVKIPYPASINFDRKMHSKYGLPGTI